MKPKNLIIGLVAILALSFGVFLYLENQPSYTFYKDEKNKVGFEKSTEWFVGSTEGYIQVSEDTADPSKPSILVKLEYPESIIPALGLDVGEQVMIGDKTMRRVDSETKILAVADRPASTVTYTELLWEAPDGRKIIFEISPWQKPKFDPSIEKFLTSFNPLP